MLFKKSKPVDAAQKVIHACAHATWWRVRMKRGRNRRFRMAEDFLEERDAHPLDDAFWASKRPNLAAIEVPALVCASWSDHGLHTRGSLEGYEQIASAHLDLESVRGGEDALVVHHHARAERGSTVKRRVKGQRRNVALRLQPSCANFASIHERLAE